MLTTYIYKLIDPRNLKIRYIGKTSRPKDRKYLHFTGRGKTYCSNWIKGILEDGLLPIMEVIDEVTSNDPRDWVELEQYWIKKHWDMGCDLTNLTEGGEGAVGYRHTDESKRKIAEKSFGRVILEETRIKISAAQLGVLESQETKDKLSEMRAGVKKTPAQIEAVRLSHLGSKRSAESCMRMSLAQKEIGRDMAALTEAAKHANTGRKHTEEHKAKVKAAITGKVRSPEQVERYRQAAILRGEVPGAVSAMNAAVRGKKQTPEQIAKRVEATRRSKEARKLAQLVS